MQTGTSPKRAREHAPGTTEASSANPLRRNRSDVHASQHAPGTPLASPSALDLSPGSDVSLVNVTLRPQSPQPRAPSPPASLVAPNPSQGGDGCGDGDIFGDGRVIDGPPNGSSAKTCVFCQPDSDSQDPVDSDQALRWKYNMPENRQIEQLTECMSVGNTCFYCS